MPRIGNSKSESTLVDAQGWGWGGAMRSECLTSTEFQLERRDAVGYSVVPDSATPPSAAHQAPGSSEPLGSLGEKNSGDG